MKKNVVAFALSIACATGAWAWLGAKTQPIEAPVQMSMATVTGGTQSESSSTNAGIESNSGHPKPEPEPDPQAAEDERMSSIVPGTWETNREGRRVLTVLTDGTATMDVTVEGAFAFIVGSRMKFNIKWKIVDGTLDFEMIDGEPESSVNTIISLYGKKKVQKILEFSPNKFVLKDNDGDEDHVWSRIDMKRNVERTWQPADG